MSGASPFDFIDGAAPADPTKPPKIVFVSFIGPISDKNVEALMARLNGEINNGATTIQLALSTAGGTVAAGFTAYHLLKGLPVELVTHNAGYIGSIGNVVFLAGAKRYASPASTFWFHGTTNNRKDANAASFQSAIEGIEIDNKRTIELIRKETGMSGPDAETLLTSVGITKDATSAMTMGIVHEIRDWNIPHGSSFFQMILDHTH